MTDPPVCGSVGPSEKKLKVIDDTIGNQRHLTGDQREQLRQVLIRQHEAVSLGKSDMGRSAAVPPLLHPKSEEPAYVKQFPINIPAAHLHFINEQINKLLALGAIREVGVPGIPQRRHLSR